MLSIVHFHCKSCSHKFSSDDFQTTDDPATEWHPYEYSCICPECGDIAGQAAWEKNLLKAQANATGPKTKEGKMVSSQNAKGHDTSNTRFNALQHGAYAKTAVFYPARPGKYSSCEMCEYKDNVCSKESTPPACLKKTELFMQYHIAFDTGDAKLLQVLNASTQAGVAAILNDMILSVAQEGVMTKTPQWHTNPITGKAEVVTYNDEHGKNHTINNLAAHPLISKIIDYMNKNSMSMADMGMTANKQDDPVLQGNIQKLGGASMNDIVNQQRIAQQKFIEVITGENTSAAKE